MGNVVPNIRTCLVQIEVRSEKEQEWKTHEYDLFVLDCQYIVGGHYLSRSDVDAGGVGVAVSSVWTITVVDWLTLISVLPPAAQTLTGVSTRSCLYTFGLQGDSRASREGPGQTGFIKIHLTLFNLQNWFSSLKKHTFTLQPPRRGGAQGSDSTQVRPSPW